MTASIDKTCFTCNADVSSQKRFKDAAGNYYCTDCWEARGEDSGESAQPVRSVSQSSAAPKLARCSVCNVGVRPDMLNYAPTGDLVCPKCYDNPQVNRDIPMCTNCGEVLPHDSIKATDTLCKACRKTMAPKVRRTVAKPQRKPRKSSYDPNAPELYGEPYLSGMEWLLVIVFPPIMFFVGLFRLRRAANAGTMIGTSMAVMTISAVIRWIIYLCFAHPFS